MWNQWSRPRFTCAELARHINATIATNLNKAANRHPYARSWASRLLRALNFTQEEIDAILQEALGRIEKQGHVPFVGSEPVSPTRLREVLRNWLPKHPMAGEYWASKEWEDMVRLSKGQQLPAELLPRPVAEMLPKRRQRPRTEADSPKANRKDR